MQNLKTYLTQKNSNGRTKFIDLRLNPPFLTRTWGLNGGKAQSTKHTYNTISQGKANELTPEQAAKEDYHRIIAQKCKEGYVVKRSDSHDIQKS